MTSLVVPGLDTLRQWLDDLGMSFFECDNCQALHLPHMQDDNLPKLVVCQSLSVMQGVTYEQFAWFVRQSEEQISMVILEANAHQLLLPTDDEGQNNVTENYFLH